MSTAPTGVMFGYDFQLYDRRFLNCFQRHAMVFLAKLGVPVDLLFYNAFPTSDAVLEQMVMENKPKYAFTSPFFCDTDLALLGISVRTTKAERLDDLLPHIEQQIDTLGFALLVGDVFCFSHCVEYQTSHAQHVVVLRKRHADGSWDIVDDNPASVLYEYHHPHAAVAAFFASDGFHGMFSIDVATSPVLDPAAEFSQRYFAGMATREDTGRFYRQVGQLIDNPFSAPVVKYRALHDAFTLLSGSRACLARYLKLISAPDHVIGKIAQYSEAAGVLKGLVVKANLTGRLNKDDLIARCAALEDIEREFAAALRTFAGRFTAPGSLQSALPPAPLR
jgi:hypothetical protein